MRALVQLPLSVCHRKTSARHLPLTLSLVEIAVLRIPTGRPRLRAESATLLLGDEGEVG